MQWLYFVIGILVGLLLFWLLYWFWLRRRWLRAEALLQTKLGACTQETAKLQAQLASLQSAQPVQTRSGGVDIPLEPQTDAAGMVDLQSRLDAATAEITGLKAEIGGLKTEAAAAKDLKVRLDNATAELSKLKQQAFALERVQTELAKCQAKTADQQQEIVRLNAALASGATPAAPAAVEPAAAALRGGAADKAAAAPAKPDDLIVIEGIGPKINELLNAAGIRTFAQLAATSQERLQAILDGGGRRFSLADPGTWPQQAALARDGKWDDFAALVARLKGGRAV